MEGQSLYILPGHYLVGLVGILKPSELAGKRELPEKPNDDASQKDRGGERAHDGAAH
jgi:hypothetical protein